MKRFLSVLLCLSFLWAPAAAATADTSSRTMERAYALKSLGIFQGDADGFGLDNRPTRLEGFVLLIRLLGEEGTAKTGSYTHPFTDVPAWGRGYVGYGYRSGLTVGVGGARFGTAQSLTAAEYCTWLLRALGYSEDRDGFTLQTAVRRAQALGLADSAQAARWAGGVFTRSDLVNLSYAALTICGKGETRTLAQKLAGAGVFTEESARAAGVWPGTSLPASTGEPAAVYVADGLYELCSAATGGDMTAVPAAEDGRGGVWITARSSANTQKFTVKNLGNRTVRLLAAGADGKAVNANPVSSGTQPYFYNENGTDSQYFVFYREQDGAYSIRMASDSALALTNVQGRLTLRPYQGGDDQQWLLLPTALSSAGSAAPDTASVAAALEQLLKRYPDGYQLPEDYACQGAIQCMGFAREVWYRLFGTDYTDWSYPGTPVTDNIYRVARLDRGQYTEENLRKLIAQAWPGDIIQFDEPKPHSMIYVWRSTTGFGVYDANWGYDLKVHRHSFLYGGLAGQDSDHISLLRYTNYPIK
ncbi:MAG: RICIN domain-containing protein [Intestinibacillus sp.]